jgi:NAD(P)-dependent dehydrogenase (short-subunit alcohol dehydrogenase family)
MQKAGKKKPLRKRQTQRRPGIERRMKPAPEVRTEYPGSGRLAGKVALITGGDSGIGRAVAVLFAKEGASVAIAFLNERQDAEDTKAMVERHGSQCIIIPGDLSKEKNCQAAVAKTIKKFGKIDILVNNAAVHYEEEKMEDITTEHLLKTFSTNFFSYFWTTKAALEHMQEGSCIINTSSVTAYRGSGSLIDYASTKGAIVSFTRSLAANLVKRKIRVNGVAPGPIWTPLIASTFDRKKVSTFGSDAPMERAGEPSEVAPSYLFLACEDSSYITGQFIHPNGGEIVNA